MEDELLNYINKQFGTTEVSWHVANTQAIRSNTTVLCVQLLRRGGRTCVTTAVRMGSGSNGNPGMRVTKINK